MTPCRPFSWAIFGTHQNERGCGKTVKILRGREAKKLGDDRHYGIRCDRPHCVTDGGATYHKQYGDGRLDGCIAKVTRDNTIKLYVLGEMQMFTTICSPCLYGSSATTTLHREICSHSNDRHFYILGLLTASSPLLVQYQLSESPTG